RHGGREGCGGAARTVLVAHGQLHIDQVSKPAVGVLPTPGDHASLAYEGVASVKRVPKSDPAAHQEGCWPRPVGHDSVDETHDVQGVQVGGGLLRGPGILGVGVTGEVPPGGSGGHDPPPVADDLLNGGQLVALDNVLEVTLGIGDPLHPRYWSGE